MTVPEHIRDALGLGPGSAVDVEVDQHGRDVLRPARAARGRLASDRFEAARGKATVPWRTDALMRLLRDAG